MYWSRSTSLKPRSSSATSSGIGPRDDDPDAAAPARVPDGLERRRHRVGIGPDDQAVEDPAAPRPGGRGRSQPRPTPRASDTTNGRRRPAWPRTRDRVVGTRPSTRARARRAAPARPPPHRRRAGGRSPCPVPRGTGSPSAVPCPRGRTAAGHAGRPRRRSSAARSRRTARRAAAARSPDRVARGRRTGPRGGRRLRRRRPRRRRRRRRRWSRPAHGGS